MISQSSTISAPLSSLTFIDEIMASTPGTAHLRTCIQCGICGGSCPIITDEIDTPRRLVALARAEYREDVLHSKTPWMCVSCYMCVERCPQQISMPDVMYAIKRMTIHTSIKPNRVARDFSNGFMWMVRHFGRNYELGLAMPHYLVHFPLRMIGMLPTSLNLLIKGRLKILPHRIKNINQLQVILKCAQELEPC